MTWTVGAGDVSAFTYMLMSKFMLLAFDLATTTIAGTPNTALQITIPGGASAATSIRNQVRALDNAVTTRAFAFTNGTTVQIYRDDVAVWTASVDNTAIQGQIAIPLA